LGAEGLAQLVNLVAIERTHRLLAQQQEQLRGLFKLFDGIGGRSRLLPETTGP